MDNEPVVACPPSRLYRLRKTVRRNKLAFAASAAVAAALLVGIVVSTWQAERARHAERTAKAEKDSAEAVLTFLRDEILAAGRPDGQAGGLGKNVTLRQAIEVAESQIAKAFENRPLVEAAIRKTLGESYRHLGEPASAIRQLERALELRRQELGLENEHTLGTMLALSEAYRETGKSYPDLVLYLRDKLELMKAKRGPDDPLSLATMNNLAMAYKEMGKADEALPLYEETLKRVNATLAPEDPNTLTTMDNLAAAYRAANKLDNALPLLEAVVKRSRTFTRLHNLADAYRAAGKHEQALPLVEEKLKLIKAERGREHPYTLGNMNELAYAYYRAGKQEQALAVAEEAFALSKANLGLTHPVTIKAENNLGLSYRHFDKLDEALALLEEALRSSNAEHGPDAPGTITMKYNIGLTLWDLGKRDDAVRLYEEVVQFRKAKLAPQHTSTLDGMHTLATAYRDTGKTAQALSLFQELLELNADTRGSNHSETLAGLARTLLLEAARIKSAEPNRSQELAHKGGQMLREYLAAARSGYPSDPLKLADKLAEAAELYYRHGIYAEAEPVYREMIQLRRSGLSADHKDVIEPTASLARVLSDWAWSERDSKSEVRNPASEPSGANRNEVEIAEGTQPAEGSPKEGGGSREQPAERAREAERLLREVLAVRQRDSSKSWRTDDVKSRLGGALVSVAVTDPGLDAEGREAKLNEAEPLLLEGCERVQTGATDDKYKRDALERLVRLYEAWNKPDKRAEWQQKLEWLDKPREKSPASESLVQETPAINAETK
ncbi:MAG: tetratricopeptide repeat protein [Verrucomicrobiales bacterium]